MTGHSGPAISELNQPSLDRLERVTQKHKTMELFPRTLNLFVLLIFSDLPSDEPALARKAGTCGTGLAAGAPPVYQGQFPGQGKCWEPTTTYMKILQTDKFIPCLSPGNYHHEENNIFIIS